MDTVVVVKHKVLVEGRSRRQVASELGISRNTVRRYLEGATPGTRLPSSRRRPVSDAVDARLLALLEESKSWTDGKQKLTARRLHALVTAEGLRCGYTKVKEVVARWRARHLEVFVPLAWQPGDAAEVDFFEVLVDVAGVRRKAWMFLMRLMHSGRDFARVYRWQDQPSFLDGHVRAFEHFGGVPARVIYDNLKPAVARILAGAERQLSKRFAALAAHHAFEPCFARPRTGHDKGGVEARGKALRRQLMVPIPSGSTLEDINRTLLDGLDAQADTRCNAEGVTVRARFEREGLHPLPTAPFEPAATVSVATTSSALCRVKGATYSVPSSWARTSVLVRVGADTLVFVGQNDEKYATPRLAAGQRHVDYRHYLVELQRKPQALRQVAGILCAQLGAPFTDLWSHLCQRREPLDAARAFAKVLGVLDGRTDAQVRARIVAALAAEEDFPACMLPRAAAPAPREHVVPHALRAHLVEASRVADYDRLLGGAA